MDVEIESMQEYCNCGFINFVSKFYCAKCGKKLKKKKYKQITLTRRNKIMKTIFYKTPEVNMFTKEIEWKERYLIIN